MAILSWRISWIDDFQVGHVAALDQRAGAVHQLEHALLDQRGQLESAADLVHDFVALQCFDHRFRFLHCVCV